MGIDARLGVKVSRPLKSTAVKRKKSPLRSV